MQKSSSRYCHSIYITKNIFLEIFITFYYFLIFFTVFLQNIQQLQNLYKGTIMYSKPLYQQSPSQTSRTSSYFISIDSTYPFQKINLRKQHNLQLQRSIFVQKSSQLEEKKKILSELSKNNIKSIIAIQQWKQCKQKIDGVERIIFIVSYQCVNRSLEMYLGQIENQEVKSVIIQHVYNRIKECLIQLLMNKIAVSEIKIGNIGIDTQFEVLQKNQSFLMKQQCLKTPPIKLYIDAAKCTIDNRKISFKDKVAELDEYCQKLWDQLSKMFLIKKNNNKIIENPQSKKIIQELTLETFVPLKYQLKPAKIISNYSKQNIETNKNFEQLINSSKLSIENFRRQKDYSILDKGCMSFRQSISSNYNDSFNQSTMSVFTNMQTSSICNHVDLTIDHSRKVLQNFKKNIKTIRNNKKNSKFSFKDERKKIKTQGSHLQL